MNEPVKKQRKSDQVADYKVGQTIGVYEIQKQLKGGSFGKLFIVKHETTKKRYAMKISTLNTKAKLKNEYDLCMAYRKGSEKFGEDFVNHAAIVPKVFLYAQLDEKEAEQCVFVMELLGMNVADFARRQDRGLLNLNQIRLLGCRVIRGLQIFHGLGWAHGDLKPENLMLVEDSLDEVRLIDFGLSKSFMISKKQHIQEGNRSISGTWGTPRYMAISTHQKKALTRRDDLETLIYVLLFLHLGSLPWQFIGRQNNNNAQSADQAKAKEEHTQLVMLSKMKTDEYFGKYETLWPLVKAWRYIRTIGFDEEPDYGKLISYLEKLEG